MPELFQKLQNKKYLNYFPYKRIMELIFNNSYSLRVPLYRCPACSSSVAVGADGVLYPCVRFGGMQNWQVGHVTTGPDHSLCRKFWYNYRQAISQKCQKCWAWPVCQGPCSWELIDSDGSFHDTPRYCSGQKRHCELAAYLYHRVSKEFLENMTNSKPETVCI